MSNESKATQLAHEAGFTITVDDEDADNYCIEINTRQTRQSILGDHFICVDQTCTDAIEDDEDRDTATIEELWKFVVYMLEHDVNECDFDCDECESW